MMEDAISFEGRVAVVTGAGAGLGRTYALELAKRGAKVVVNDLGGARDGAGTGTSGPADKVVEEIRALGGEAVANYDNVATEEGGEGIVKTAVDKWGKVDVLINNAGILRDYSLLKMEPAAWDAVIAVHLRGAYCVTRPAFRVMKENNYGRILMTTSPSGLFGNFGQANYGAAKMGLVGFMNTLKLEGAKNNIGVNTIAPIAASRMTEDVFPEEMMKTAAPEFITPMATYLCSEQCKESGSVYLAGFGVYERVAVVAGRPVRIGSDSTLPSAEDIRNNMGEINSLEAAAVRANVNEAVDEMIKLISG